MRAHADAIRWPLRAGLLAALCLVAAPKPAACEGEPSLFSLRPSFSGTLVADDNPELAKSGEDSKLGAWLRPRLEADYRSPRVDLGADLGVDVRRYAGFDSGLSDEFARVRGFADLKLAPGLSLRLEDAWMPRATELGRPEDEGVNLVQSNRLGAGLRHWRALGGERELEMGIAGTYFVTEDFATPISSTAIDGDFHANHAGGLGYVELQSPLFASTSGFLRAQAGYRALEDDSQASHADVGGSLGARVQLGGGSTFEIGGGAGWLGFAGLSDRPRAMARTSLRLRLPAGFVATFGVTHLLTANLEGRRVDETDGRIEIERWFGRRTAVSIAGFGTRYDDRTLGASDLFGGGEARVRRQLSRSLELVLRFRHWSNGGDLEQDDFAQNRGTLELRFAPSLL